MILLIFSCSCCTVGRGWSGVWGAEAMGLAWLVSQSFWVFQVGGKGQSQQRDPGEEVAVSCRLITAVWEVLCTWRSPARHTPWHRRSLSAKRWSSSGPPEPCACEEEARDRQQMRGGKQMQQEKEGTASNTTSAVAQFFFLSAVKTTGGGGQLPNDKTKSCALASGISLNQDHKWRISVPCDTSLKQEHMLSLEIWFGEQDQTIKQFGGEKERFWIMGSSSSDTRWEAEN